MKTLYLDAFSGISGNMFIGALLDAGLSREKWEPGIRSLELGVYELIFEKVRKGVISSTYFNVKCEDSKKARHIPEICGIIRKGDLPDEVKEKSIKIFERLGEAEGKVHGYPPEKVHLHEAGAVDAIIDVVGTCLGLYILGIEKIACSILPVGGGFIESEHGKIPIPAPATLELLTGVPIKKGPVEKEIVTPTGAVLASTLAESFGDIPAMTVEEIGYGAGTWDFDHPNVLRIMIGQSEEAGIKQEMLVVETNIDDMNPELYGHIMEKLFEAGAVDVYMMPIQMKKNRPAVLLSALCSPETKQQVIKTFYRETTTLGLRVNTVERWCLPRETRKIDTKYGTVTVKIVKRGDEIKTAAPEYEGCRELALKQSVPLAEVYAAAQEAIRKLEL